MALKTFKPTSAGRRFMTISDFEELTTDRPYKPLTETIRKTGGRNNAGRVSVRHHGGGHKQLYRIIDFKRDKDAIPARVQTIEYDPNRTCRIALIAYADGEKRYILAPAGMKAGDVVVSGAQADILPGNCLPLANIPVGTMVHNVELKPGRGGQLARSAGTAAQLMAREEGYALLRMPSGELRKVREVCRATIGQIGNDEHSNVSLGKAGRSRWLGVRPTVRGMSMNPVDHPNGGGEGRGKGGIPRSPWGQVAKGGKTRNNKRTDQYIVRRRSK